MKNTGIELIAEERQEQIEKHGYTISMDYANNCAKELAYVAHIMLAAEWEEGIDPNVFPENWDIDIINKMLHKQYKERLIIAGALIAAEIDRLQS